MKVINLVVVAFSNSRCPKPLLPKVTVHIASDTPGVARTLPILAAYPLGDAEAHCLLVYGSLIRPGFEEIVIKNVKYSFKIGWNDLLIFQIFVV